MTALNTIATYTDSTSITLKELLPEIVMEAEKRDIPCSDGLQWWLRWYPAAESADAKECYCVVVHTNKTSMLQMTLIIGAQLQEVSNFKFATECKAFVFHEDILPLFQGGELTIRCDVKIKVKVPFAVSIPRNFKLFSHVPADVEIIVGCERIQVHKFLLMSISPVFLAMFSHDTAESKSGQVEIDDFDSDTVKSAVELCYGRELQNPSLDTVISILRFADKYNIAALMDQFDRCPEANLSVKTFCPVVRYAYDFNKTDLLSKCCKLYKSQYKQIKILEKFVKLPPVLVAEILKISFDLKTDFDILRNAHKNGINFVCELLEQRYFLNLSVDSFCAIVHYAYDCNKDALLTPCWNFFKDHQDEIKVTSKFVELPPDLVVDLLKSAFGLKSDVDVLRHAYKNGITFVVEHLEELCQKGITIHNFSPTAKYAWECSRVDVKKACAEFYNDNLVEVMNLKDFHDLPFDTIGKIVVFSYNLKHAY